MSDYDRLKALEKKRKEVEAEIEAEQLRINPAPRWATTLVGQLQSRGIDSEYRSSCDSVWVTSFRGFHATMGDGIDVGIATYTNKLPFSLKRVAFLEAVVATEKIMLGEKS